MSVSLKLSQFIDVKQHFSNSTKMLINVTRHCQFSAKLLGNIGIYQFFNVHPASKNFCYSSNDLVMLSILVCLKSVKRNKGMSISH